VRPIRIRDNLQLAPNAYRFKIRGVDITGGELMPNYYLAMNPDDNEADIEGLKTIEPTFGLPAWWIKEENKEKAEMESFTVVDAATVLITHLTEFIKSYANEILSRQDVQDLLDMVKEKNEALVNELIPNLLTVGEVQKVFQSFLKEKVSIRDIETILEALVNAARTSKNMDYLIEYSRQALMRSISKQYAHDGKITVVTLDPHLEAQLAEAIKNNSQGSYLAISPQLTELLLEQIKRAERQFLLLGLSPVILCSSRIRLPLRRLVERFNPSFAVLGTNELTPDLAVEVKSVVMANEN
jgi:flagellar biosynthesis protein FlhA